MRQGTPAASPPEVTIVLATYDRPDILPFAISQCSRARGRRLGADRRRGRLRAGDRRGGCAVRRSAHPLYQPALNWGEQSGPNNVGARAGAGTLSGFSQPRRFLVSRPLRASLDWLAASGADGVIARSVAVMPAARGADPIPVREVGGEARGAAHHRRPASPAGTPWCLANGTAGAPLSRLQARRIYRRLARHSRAEPARAPCSQRRCATRPKSRRVRWRNTSESPRLPWFRPSVRLPPTPPVIKRMVGPSGYIVAMQSAHRLVGKLPPHCR
jgi:hypothetical protein